MIVITSYIATLALSTIKTALALSNRAPLDYHLVEVSLFGATMTTTVNLMFCSMFPIPAPGQLPNSTATRAILFLVFLQTLGCNFLVFVTLMVVVKFIRWLGETTTMMANWIS